MTISIFDLYCQLQADHVANLRKSRFMSDASLDQLIVELAQTTHNEASVLAAISDFILRYYLGNDDNSLQRAKYVQKKFGTQRTRDATAVTFALADATCHARSHCWFEMVKCLTPQLSNSTALQLHATSATEVLILLSVAYSMLSRIDDAVKSAKLAVDMCHNLIERAKEHSNHVNSIALPFALLLPLSYYALASQLQLLDHMEEAAADWYQRCLSLCRKERLSDSAVSLVTSALDALNDKKNHINNTNEEQEDVLRLESPEIGEDTSLSVVSDDVLFLQETERMEYVQSAVVYSNEKASARHPYMHKEKPPVAPIHHPAQKPAIASSASSSAVPPSSYDSYSSAENSSTLQYSSDGAQLHHLHRNNTPSPLFPNQAHHVRPRPLSAAPRLVGDTSEQQPQYSITTFETTPAANNYGDPFLSLDAHFAAKRVLKLETIDDVSYITEEEGPSPAYRRRPKSAVSKLGGSYVSTSVSSPSHQRHRNSYSSQIEERTVEQLTDDAKHIDEEHNSLMTIGDSSQSGGRENPLETQTATDGLGEQRTEETTSNRGRSANLDTLQALYDELKREAHELDRRVSTLRDEHGSYDKSQVLLSSYLRHGEIREAKRWRRLEKQCELISDMMLHGLVDERRRLVRQLATTTDRYMEGMEVEMRCDDAAIPHWISGAIVLERCDGTYDIEANVDGALFVGVPQEALRSVKAPHIPVCVGDFVECSVLLPCGAQRWIACYVEAILDGSFTVEYLDGSIEQKVPVSRIRSMPTTQKSSVVDLSYAIGTPVVIRVRFGLHWRQGTIVRKRKNHAYDVQLNDSHAHIERGVPICNIRLLGDCAVRPSHRLAASQVSIVTKTAQQKQRQDATTSIKTLAKLRDELREKNNLAAQTIQRAARRRLSQDLNAVPEALHTHDVASPTNSEELLQRFRQDMHRHHRLMRVVSSERFVANRLRQEQQRHECAIVLQRCVRRYLAVCYVRARRIQTSITTSFLETQYSILECEQSLLCKLLDSLRAPTDNEESNVSAIDAKHVPPSSVGSLIDDNDNIVDNLPHLSPRAAAVSIDAAALAKWKDEILESQETQWRLYEIRIRDIVRQNNALIAVPPLAQEECAGPRSLHGDSQEIASISSSVQLPSTIPKTSSVSAANPVEDVGEAATSVSCASQDFVQCGTASISSSVMIERSPSTGSSKSIYEAVEVVALSIDAPFEFLVSAANVDGSLTAASADSDAAAAAHFVVFQKNPEASGTYDINISWEGGNEMAAQCTISVESSVVANISASHTSHEIYFRTADGANADGNEGFTLRIRASSLRLDHVALSLQSLWELHVGWFANELVMKAALQSEILHYVASHDRSNSDIYNAVTALRNKRESYLSNRSLLEQKLRDLLLHWVYGVNDGVDDCDVNKIQKSLEAAALELLSPATSALQRCDVAVALPKFVGSVEASIKELQELCDDLVTDFYLTNIVTSEKFVPLFGRCRIISRIGCDEVSSFQWESWQKLRKEATANWNDPLVDKFIHISHQSAESPPDDKLDAILETFVDDINNFIEKKGTGQVRVEYEGSDTQEKELSRFSQSELSSVDEMQESSTELVYDIASCDEVVAIRITSSREFLCRDFSLHDERVNIPCCFLGDSAKASVEQWLLFPRCSTFENKYLVDIAAGDPCVGGLVVSDSEITSHAMSKQHLSLTLQNCQYMLQISILRFGEVEDLLQSLWDAQVAWQVQAVLIAAAAQEMIMRSIAYFASYERLRAESMSTSYQLISDVKDFVTSARSMHLQYSDAIAKLSVDSTALIDKWLPSIGTNNNSASAFAQSLRDELHAIAIKMVSSFVSLTDAPTSNVAQMANAAIQPDFIKNQLDAISGDLRNLFYEFVEEVRVADFMGASQLLPLLSRCKVIGHSGLDHLSSYPWVSWAESKVEWWQAMLERIKTESSHAALLTEKFASLATILADVVTDVPNSGDSNECSLDLMNKIHDVAVWILSSDADNAKDGEKTDQ